MRLTEHFKEKFGTRYGSSSRTRLNSGLDNTEEILLLVYFYALNSRGTLTPVAAQKIEPAFTARYVCEPIETIKTLMEYETLYESPAVVVTQITSTAGIQSLAALITQKKLISWDEDGSNGIYFYQEPIMLERRKPTPATVLRLMKGGSIQMKDLPK